MNKVAGIIIGVVALTSIVAAQRGGESGQPAGQGGRQGAPGAGATQPLGRGDYQPTTWWGDDMFPKWPYPAGDAVYADLDGAKIKRYIDDVTAISRMSRDDGNQYWGRITGSPYDRMNAEWVEAQFKRIGLEKRIEELAS